MHQSFSNHDHFLRPVKGKNLSLMAYFQSFFFKILQIHPSLDIKHLLQQKPSPLSMSDYEIGVAPLIGTCRDKVLSWMRGL